MPQPRALPHSLEAEQEVLAASLGKERQLEIALAGLEPEHFYLDRHRRIFETMRDLHLRGEPCSPLTVCRELEARHQLATLVGVYPVWQGGDEAGEAAGRGYFAQLVAGCSYPSDSVFERYVRMVRDAWGKRRLIEVFTPPMRSVWNGGSAASVLRDVQRAVIDAHAEIEDDGEACVVSMFDAVSWLEQRVKNPPQRREGVAVPFSFLPRFQPGRLHVLGGYPGDGKTAVSAQFVKAAAKEGCRVGLVSVEMSWEDLTTRLVASYGLPYLELQRGIVPPPLEGAYKQALADLAKMQVDLIDDAAVTASDIARYQKLGRYDYLVIDYLQRMPFVDRQDLNRQIKAITTLARTAQIPILLLSQFSRPQQTNGHPRPTMTMFAETSMIEKEAALALAVWRRRDETGTPGPEAELLILKNRYGPVGKRDLWFDGKDVRFTEVEH